MYNYNELKRTVLTENGVLRVLKIMDNATTLGKMSGVFTMEKLLVGLYGDSWENMAAVDFLVEHCKLKEIPTTGWGQHRVFKL